MLSRLRSPPLSVFLTAVPTTASRRSLKPSSTNFPSRRRDRSRRDKCGRANRGRELQIFADGQMFIERVLLRNVTDVALQLIEIRIKLTGY